MAKYKNGQIPANLLVRRGNIRLTAGTWAKWDALVADVKDRHGVTLTITQGSGVTTGSGGYRDLAMQRAVKQKYIELGKPNQAATEGTSSHGGEYRGRDAMAVDVNNYWAIPRAEFFAAARRAGFNPNVFDGKGGRPLEDWHLIDYDPYRKVEDMPTAEEIARAVWTYESTVNKRKFGDMLRRVFNVGEALYETNRYGREGVRHHGTATKDYLARLARLEANQQAQLAALEALAKSNGADPAAILKAVEQGVSRAMDKIEVTLTVDAEG